MFRGKKKTLVMAIDLTEAWSSSLKKNPALLYSPVSLMSVCIFVVMLCHAVQENVHYNTEPE